MLAWQLLATPCNSYMLLTQQQSAACYMLSGSTLKLHSYMFSRHSGSNTSACLAKEQCSAVLVLAVSTVLSDSAGLSLCVSGAVE